MYSKFFFKVVNRQDGWAQPYDEPRLLSFSYYYMWQRNNSENHVQTSVNKLLLLLLCRKINYV